jgi:hypothetical protein
LNKLNKDKVPKEVFDRLQAEIEGIQRDKGELLYSPFY